MIMREIDDGLGNSLIIGGFELQTTCIPGSNPLGNKEAIPVLRIRLTY